MHKPLHLLIASFCSLLCYGQKTDTLVLFYKADQFSISKPDLKRLDSFMLRGWDRLSINGYTDETEGEEYNLELSSKRADEVVEYFIAKGIPDNYVFSKYFGESMPKASNSTDDGRALNRRTEIIGYQFRKIKAVTAPVADPMTPVTKTLDNGFIITYRPGSMPGYMASNFEAGLSSNFQLITNTAEMRQNNFYNNTTNGGVLSSVLIICGNQANPCKLDSPVLFRVPIPMDTKCPIEKVRFFNAVLEKGKRIWQEESKLLYPEMIGGKKYIRIWLDNLCGCINFDFKVDPECFDTDSTQVLYVNADIKNLTAELKGLNSVYLPRKVNDSTYSVLFLKNKINEAPVTFTLYKGKRRIRAFRNKSLSAFPYDKTSNRYVLSADSLRIYFSKLKVMDVILKVNNDKYKTIPERNKYDFVYLNRKDETILVDFWIEDSRGRDWVFKDKPIDSLPYDMNKKQWVIGKKFIKKLQLERMTASKTKRSFGF